MNLSEKLKMAYLLPVFIAFFVMGFVDIVGVSTSYVKNDFALNDTLANLLPMMVFVWFAICSIPTGILMGRIGRKKMVLCSLALTSLSMILPLLGYSFPIVLVAFMLLGISNTMLQVSLNPLLMDMIRPERVTSMITLGNFVKAISSTLGPLIVSMAVGKFQNWHLIFWVYAILSFFSFLCLLPVRAEETRLVETQKGISRICGLLKSGKMLLIFSVILLSVGFEIGLMTAVPKYFVERCSSPIAEASIGCSVYFVGRTLGTFLGSFLFNRFNAKRLMLGSVLGGIVLLGLFLVLDNLIWMMILLFFIGLTCANIFPFVFSQGLQANREKANEASALMIMGVAGGAILPVFMGMIADASSQCFSLLLPLAVLIYIEIALYKI
ncbi:MAG TPA: MFS transporter [Candidatus Parabacteroides faecavium]|nr:MFS transporter [Candidatus Parabacteroides faecavium]